MPFFILLKDNTKIDYSQVTYHRNFCFYCGEENVIMLNGNDLEFWQSGEFIQSAFPYLHIDQRELIKTGIHSECWDTMFKTSEE